jgi:EAL domain-containing protein (putative c-di-GMP-specific phosphodiesterase class I)
VLCEAIIVMAHKLGLKVIAEGIETAQQKSLLIKMGCDYGQGYLFSRPKTIDKLLIEHQLGLAEQINSNLNTLQA